MEQRTSLARDRVGCRSSAPVSGAKLLFTTHNHEAIGQAEALAPEAVANLIVWFDGAPPELVLHEATVTPPHEQGWP